MTTRLYTHPIYLEHLTPAGHPERPDRLRAIERVLDEPDFEKLDRQLAPLGDEATIAYAHPQSHLEMLRTRIPQEGIARIDADITDSELRAPRAGRVQYLVAQPGEVLGAGGKVLNMVDLADVYMTFFLPERAAGRVALGQDVRIILDAAPQYVIPAKVSFVASTAQFTPKTVETASERQKLMFRVKAQIDPKLLQQHLQQVKTGVPGVAWLKLDADAAWPANLEVKVP